MNKGHGMGCGEGAWPWPCVSAGPLQAVVRQGRNPCARHLDTATGCSGLESTVGGGACVRGVWSGRPVQAPDGLDDPRAQGRGCIAHRDALQSLHCDRGFARVCVEKGRGVDRRFARLCADSGVGAVALGFARVRAVRAGSRGFA